MKYDFDKMLINFLCKDMSFLKILNYWLCWEGGGGESSFYIFIEKRMLFLIVWVWFLMNIYLCMYIMFDI